jgi:hypothetical protein
MRASMKLVRTISTRLTLPAAVGPSAMPALVLLGIAACGQPPHDETAQLAARATGSETTAEVYALGPSVSSSALPSASSSATPIRSAASSATTSNDPDPGTPTPKELTPEFARGTCSDSDRAMLKTAAGDVRCYPLRCRNGRCLLTCDKRHDCAGSDGPGDLAKNGWPLDCANHECFPLSPEHVQPH